MSLIRKLKEFCLWNHSGFTGESLHFLGLLNKATLGMIFALPVVTDAGLKQGKSK